MGKHARAAALVAAGCFMAALGAGITQVKFTSFTAVGSGTAENPDVDGMCKVKYVSSLETTSLQLTISGLLPSTTYGVQLDGFGSGFSDPLAFTTNSQGHGSYHHDVPQDATPGATVKIYIFDGDTENIFDVSEAEIRAAGNPEA